MSAKGTSTEHRATDRATSDFRYLPYVDGLRALSVLSVVGYHIGFDALPGGFVGVDVFFVISGFLIINQIIGEMEQDRFSVFGFYMRRAFRILPSYFVMLAAVLLVAPFVLFVPDAYESFAKSAVLAPLMATNILFYSEQGYFDTSAELKPLLHTWTLSVEEQFYLAVPLILMLIFALGRNRFGRPAFVAAFAMAVVSFAGCVLLTDMQERNAAFYLTPLRAWEFILGGLIGASSVKATNALPRIVLEALGLIGLAMILYAVFVFSSKEAYPSWRALVPVSGAVLFILSSLSLPKSLVARAFSIKPVVWIGLVSYAWYLWHWPILSLLRIGRLESDWMQDFFGGGVAGLALAFLTYRFVELPVKRWRKAKGNKLRPVRIFFQAFGACAAAAAIGGLISFAGYLNNEHSLERQYRTGADLMADSSCMVSTGDSLPATCFDGEFGLLIGDSHAAALSSVFSGYFKQTGVRLITIARGGCRMAWFTAQARLSGKMGRCANLAVPYGEAIAAQPKFVVLDFSLANPDEETNLALSGILDQFDPDKTKILFVGPVPRFPNRALECVYLRDRAGISREDCMVQRAGLEASRTTWVDGVKVAVNSRPNSRYVDILDAFCDSTVCRPFGDDKLYFRDRDHVFPSGAQFILESSRRHFEWLVE